MVLFYRSRIKFGKLWEFFLFKSVKLEIVFLVFVWVFCSSRFFGEDIDKVRGKEEE